MEILTQKKTIKKCSKKLFTLLFFRYIILLDFLKRTGENNGEKID
jgi:hypothetical protein